MSQRVCPWWLGYLLASPLRRLMQDPVKVLAPYVREGMIVLEPGPGMGFFTLELARLVGPSGRIVSHSASSADARLSAAAAAIMAAFHAPSPPGGHFTGSTNFTFSAR